MPLADTIQRVLDKGVAEGDIVGAVAKIIGPMATFARPRRYSRCRQRSRYDFRHRVLDCVNDQGNNWHGRDAARRAGRAVA